MILVDVYELVDEEYLMAVTTLYHILKERPIEHGISHKKMPSFSEHIEFMETKPFRYWYLVVIDGISVGAIECLPTNEFGIHLLKEFQGKGFGRQAVELFLSTHEPLPAIPAVRNGHWCVNVAPANEGAAAFFKALGFHKIQETFEL